MDLSAFLKKVSSLVEPEGTVVTLSLDLSKSGILPPATRVFLKDQVRENLLSEARPLPVQQALRKLARRIGSLAESGVRPETNGLFLVAGRKVWEPLELMVPLRNFVTVGRAPYLAPLLEASARAPRAYVVRVDGGGARIDELHLGQLRLLESLEGAGKGGRLSGSRSAGLPGRGGAERDLRQRRDGESMHGLLREAASIVGRLHAAAPADEVYLTGRKEYMGAFRKALPRDLQDRCVHGVPAAVALDIERRAAGRVEEEIQEFHERRRQGLLTALGPRDVLEQLYTGTVARVFVDPDDPIPGVSCIGCGARAPGLRERCPFCSEDVVPVSIVQEVIGHSLAHPPLAMTFVPPGTGWLRDLDGMAALLSAKGVRRKAVAARR